MLVKYLIYIYKVVYKHVILLQFIVNNQQNVFNVQMVLDKVIMICIYVIVQIHIKVDFI